MHIVVVVVVVVVTAVILFLSLPPFAILIFFTFLSVHKCTKNQNISQTEDLSILGAGIFSSVCRPVVVWM